MKHVAFGELDDRMS